MAQQAAAEWLLTSAREAYRLWDEDVIDHCKPHYGRDPDTGRIDIDGLTIWAHLDRPRTWARFGDTIRRDDAGRYTVTSPEGETR